MDKIIKYNRRYAYLYLVHVLAVKLSPKSKFLINNDINNGQYHEHCAPPCA